VETHTSERWICSELGETAADDVQAVADVVSITVKRTRTWTSKTIHPSFFLYPGRSRRAIALVRMYKYVNTVRLSVADIEQNQQENEG